VVKPPAPCSSARRLYLEDWPQTATLPAVNKSPFASWRANFIAGLAVVLPTVISIAVVLWLFGTIATFTDTLLIFLPHYITHRDQGLGPMYWYWSLIAIVLAILIICAIGLLARNYFGKKIIQWVDTAMLRIPLVNKIYGATKQVNDAFSSGNKTSFRTVVLVEFPRAGSYSVGFVTSDQQDQFQARLNEKLVGVFVPTTPNPTSGFLVLVPESKVIKLDMTVADGIKYVVSLGAIVPDQNLVSASELKNAERARLV
jgi:uncharacterized membrane protein